MSTVGTPSYRSSVVESRSVSRSPQLVHRPGLEPKLSSGRTSPVSPMPPAISGDSLRFSPWARPVPQASGGLFPPGSPENGTLMYATSKSAASATPHSPIQSDGSRITRVTRNVGPSELGVSDLSTTSLPPQQVAWSTSPTPSAMSNLSMLRDPSQDTYAHLSATARSVLQESEAERDTYRALCELPGSTEFQALVAKAFSDPARSAQVAEEFYKQREIAYFRDLDAARAAQLDDLKAEKERMATELAQMASAADSDSGF
eukprot:ANDGO_01881.mRNA.1 hypothetical protein